MATMSERLAYVLDFDTSGAVRDVQKFGNAADKELGKADQKLDKLGSNLTKFGAGAVAFAGVAAVGLFKLGQGAAEAGANMAALEQVVGETVAADIGEWAEDSAVNVGLASKSAVAAATSFAQLGKIIGLGGDELGTFSTDLVALSADFAAFKDVSPEQALQDIQAAFAGSTEVMRKYGIFLDDATLKSAYYRETGEKVTGTLTAQQKIVAINAEMYRQGADMIGQWGRESGDFAGQTATLKASLTNLADGIGAGVLPMMTSAIGVANKGVTAFNDLSPAAQAAAGKFAAFGAAGVGLIGTLSLVAGQAIKMRDRFTRITETADGTTRSLNGFGKAAVLAGGVATVAMIGFALQAQKAARQAQQLTEAVEGVARAAEDELVAGFDKVIALEGPQFFRDMAREGVESAIKIRDLALANDEFAAKLADVGLSVEDMTAAIDDEIAAKERAAAATEAATAALEDNETATATLTSATREQATAAGILDTVTRGTAAAIDEAKRQTDDAARAAKNLELKWSELKGELDEQEAFMNLEDTFDRLETAAEEAFIAASSGADDAEAKQREYQRALLDTKQEVIDYAERIAGISPEVVSVLLAKVDHGSVAEVESILANLSRQRYPRLVPQVVGAPGGRQAMRTGGPIPGPRDAPYPITAHGGEFVLSADVVDAIKKDKPTLGINTTPTRVGSGGGTTITNYIYTNADPSQVVEAQRRYTRRN